MSEFVLHVGGMTCRHCVRHVSAVVRDVPGVLTVAIDFDAATVTVSGSTERGAVVDALTAAGYVVRDR